MLTHGHDIGDCEQQRCQDQPWRDLWRKHQWKNHKEGRADDQVQPLRIHQVQFMHIVRRAGHDIADRLHTMEGHTFAEQVGVQFLPGVALDPFADQFGTGVTHVLQHSPQRLRNQCGDSAPGDRRHIGLRPQHGIKGDPDQDRNHRRAETVTEGTDQKGDNEGAVGPGMAAQPAPRRALIKDRVTRRDKFTRGSRRSHEATSPQIQTAPPAQQHPARHQKGPRSRQQGRDSMITAVFTQLYTRQPVKTVNNRLFRVN